MSEFAKLESKLEVLVSGQQELLDKFSSLDKTIRGDHEIQGLVAQMLVLRNEQRHLRERLDAARTQARALWTAVVTLTAAVIPSVVQALSH